MLGRSCVLTTKDCPSQCGRLIQAILYARNGPTLQLTLDMKKPHANRRRRIRTSSYPAAMRSPFVRLKQEALAAFCMPALTTIKGRPLGAERDLLVGGDEELSGAHLPLPASPSTAR